jgi:hypothetical protein
MIRSRRPSIFSPRSSGEAGPHQLVFARVINPANGREKLHKVTSSGNANHRGRFVFGSEQVTLGAQGRLEGWTVVSTEQPITHCPECDVSFEASLRTQQEPICPRCKSALATPRRSPSEP